MLLLPYKGLLSSSTTLLDIVLELPEIAMVVYMQRVHLNAKNERKADQNLACAKADISSRINKS